MLIILKSRNGHVSYRVPSDVISKAQRKIRRITAAEIHKYQAADKVYYDSTRDMLIYVKKNDALQQP